MFTRILAAGGLCAISLAAAGCATGTGAEAGAGPQECRDIVLPGQEAATRVCGAPEQFAEMERRLAAAADPDMRCREMLVPDSNVIDRVCATVDQWAEYEQAEARAAQSRVWDFQGGSYNSGR